MRASTLIRSARSVNTEVREETPSRGARDWLLRTVKGGGSYLSSGDRRVVFGLGPRDRVGRLRVRWPSGKTQTWDGLAVDRYWKLVEKSEPEVVAGTRGKS